MKPLNHDDLRWGIIVPHTLDAPGARSARHSENEYGYAKRMINFMVLPWATRDEGGVSGAARKLANKYVNATIEPHKNAYNGTARGFELLVMVGDHASAEVAREIIGAFHKVYPNRILRHDGGIKWVGEKDRGYDNLLKAKKEGIKIAILSESFFIDNHAEWIEPEEMAYFWHNTLK